MTDPGPRKLNALDATLLVMGGIIGVGIFFSPAGVAAQIESPAGFLGMWLLGGAVAICGAATFAELGGTFPRSGGWFEFLREIYGPFVAFLFAWMILGVVATGAMAVIAAFGASLILDLLPGVEATPARTYAAAVAMLVSLTTLLLLGAKVGATVQNAIMLAKLAAIALLVYGGILVFTPETAPVAPGPATPIEYPPLWKGIAAAFLPVFFAFGGWQHVCYIAGDVRDPQRTLPRAILVGVTGVAFVYVLLNGAYLRVLGIDGIVGAEALAPSTAERALGEWGVTALAVGMAISALGVCLVNLLVTPGIFVAMARSGLFFAPFARLHPRTGAPVLALVAQAGIAVLYLTWSHAEGLGLVEPRAPDAEGFHMDLDSLTESVVFAEWFFHGLIAYGLLRLRRTRPELPRPYKSFLWPLAPSAYLAVALYLVGVNLISGEPSRTLVGCAVLAVGAAVYVPWRRVTAPARDRSR